MNTATLCRVSILMLMSPVALIAELTVNAYVIQGGICPGQSWARALTAALTRYVRTDCTAVYPQGISVVSTVCGRQRPHRPDVERGGCTAVLQSACTTLVRLHYGPFCSHLAFLLVHHFMPITRSFGMPSSFFFLLRAFDNI